MARLAQVEGSDAEWFLSDALGSVRQVVDDGGDVVLARDYSPFGVALSESGTGGSGYGFTGEQADAVGLIFLRARYYDPRAGRFVSPDPFPGYAGLPQTFHLFTYCLNNATNCTDPSGELPPWLDFLVGAGYQYLSDVTLGVPEQLSERMQTSTDVLSTLYQVDPLAGYVATQAYLTAIRHGLRLSDVASPCSPAYQSGRQFGRTLSYGQAIVETATGVITIVGAVAMLPPSAGAAALAGGGVASVPAVAGVVAVDIAALEAGGAMAAHGVGVLARNAGDPLSNVSYATGSGSSGRIPSDLQSTLDRIKAGRKYPHRNDGTTFKNREGLLPTRPDGYYTEYVHPTPGMSGAGPQRVVIGANGEIYYTPDHYKTFIRVK